MKTSGAALAGSTMETWGAGFGVGAGKRVEKEPVLARSDP
jgi:hypothetical protein